MLLDIWCLPHGVATRSLVHCSKFVATFRLAPSSRTAQQFIVVVIFGFAMRKQHRWFADGTYILLISVVSVELYSPSQVNPPPI